MKIFVILSTALFGCLHGIAQSRIPAAKAQSLAGTTITLPSGKPAVLVLGFSQKSSIETKAWGDPIAKDFGTNPDIDSFQMPVLQDVPRLFRGVVIQSIRKQLSPAQQAHFVPIFENSNLWKETVHFLATDDAYVVLVDGAGSIRWQTHGTFSTSAYMKLKQCAATLKEASPSC